MFVTSFTKAPCRANHQLPHMPLSSISASILYSQCTILGLRPHLLPYMRLATAKVVTTFLIIFCKWCFQLSLQSTITPKYLTSPSILSSLPWSVRGPKSSTFLLLVKGTMVVLWGLIFRPCFNSPCRNTRTANNFAVIHYIEPKLFSTLK